MSDPKYRAALVFLAIAQLSTFVLVIILLSRVPPYQQVSAQHEILKTEIVERLINSPELQNSLKISGDNARQLNDIRSIVQDVVRVEIAKAHNRPSSLLEANMNNNEVQLVSKK